MAANIVNAIDIRPDKIVCLSACELEIVNEGTFLQLVGYGIEELPLSCTDPLELPSEDLRRYIINAIKKSEKESGHLINSANINIYDKNYSIYIDDVAEIIDDKINQNDIKSFFSKKKFKSLYSHDNQPLHSFPISYRINDSKSISHPLGINANKLKTKWHIIVSNNVRIEKISSIFESIDISINQFVTNFYSMSLAILNDMETSMGSVAIDIGKTKTFISYIFDNQLIEFQEIPIGTINISKDISQIMNLSLDDADKVRKKINIMDENQLLNVNYVEYLKIYDSRCEELIELIQAKMAISKYSYLVENNIIVTGKGVKSVKLMNKIRTTFMNKKIRIGSTIKFNGLKTIINNPSLSSSFGLLIYSTIHELEVQESKTLKKQKKSIFSYIFQFFKEI